MTAAWMLEWRIVLARRRLMAWNVGVPLLLLLPVAFSEAATPHRAAVYSVFFALFGTFGSCIPLVRDRSRGWIEKLRLTGYGDRRWLGERIAAGTAIDFVQLLPTVAMLWLVSRAGWPAAAASIVAVLHALLVGNLLGGIVARWVDSLAEAALACAAAALFVLHFSGAFRSASPGTWAWWIEVLGPFRPLTEAMPSLAAGASTGGLALGGWLGPAVATAGLAVLTTAFASGLAHPPRVRA